MKLLLALALLALSACTPAGVSSRCGYTWTGDLVCESRFHHFLKPAVAVAYLYHDSNVVELQPEETSSITAPITDLGNFVP